MYMINIKLIIIIIIVIIISYFLFTNYRSKIEGAKNVSKRKARRKLPKREAKAKATKEKAEAEEAEKEKVADPNGPITKKQKDDIKKAYDEKYAGLPPNNIKALHDIGTMGLYAKGTSAQATEFLTNFKSA